MSEQFQIVETVDSDIVFESVNDVTVLEQEVLNYIEIDNQEVTFVESESDEPIEIITVGEQGPAGPPGAAGTGGGSSTKLDSRYVTAEEITQGYLILPFSATNPLKTAVTIAGGIRQFPFQDYMIEENKISWRGLALEFLLEEGSLIQVEIFS